MTQKIAVITGGATGIGKSTAMLLASKGIKVVISGRQEAAGQKVIEEIRAQGGDAAFIAADVDNETQVSQIIGFAVKKYGRLDLAVNNAGISNETKTIGDSDPAKFQAMLQTNVMGVYLCTLFPGQVILLCPCFGSFAPAYKCLRCHRFKVSIMLPVRTNQVTLPQGHITPNGGG